MKVLQRAEHGCREYREMLGPPPLKGENHFSFLLYKWMDKTPLPSFEAQYQENWTSI